MPLSLLRYSNGALQCFAASLEPGYLLRRSSLRAWRPGLCFLHEPASPPIWQVSVVHFGSSPDIGSLSIDVRFTPIADMLPSFGNVRFVPEADKGGCATTVRALAQFAGRGQVWRLHRRSRRPGHRSASKAPRSRSRPRHQKRVTLLNSTANMQEDQTSKKSEACSTLGSLMPTKVTLSLASNAILVLPPTALIVMSDMLWNA